MSIFQKCAENELIENSNCVTAGMMVILTFEEDLGWEYLDGVFAVAQVLHGCVIEYDLVRLSLQDRLLGSQELLLGILLQIGGHHGC